MQKGLVLKGLLISMKFLNKTNIICNLNLIVTLIYPLGDSEIKVTGMLVVSAPSRRQTAALLTQLGERQSAERRSQVQTPAGPTPRVFK